MVLFLILKAVSIRRKTLIFFEKEKYMRWGYYFTKNEKGELFFEIFEIKKNFLKKGLKKGLKIFMAINFSDAIKKISKIYGSPEIFKKG